MERAIYHLSGDLNSIAEVHGPGRICNAAERMGLTGGQAFDLRLVGPDDGQPWDLSLESKRCKAWWMIEEMNPSLVVGSPPCDPFSNLHSLVRSSHRTRTKEQRASEKGIVHLAFCFAIYRRRVEFGQHFLHEHPWSAWSWKLDFVQGFLSRPDVYLGRGDQCPLGQWSRDVEGPGLALKPTGWLSDSVAILQRVAVRCSNNLEHSVKHRHVRLQGGRAKPCAAYPPALERAMITGLVDQLKIDGKLKDGFIGTLDVEDDLHEALQDNSWADADSDTRAGDPAMFVDDVSGVRPRPRVGSEGQSGGTRSDPPVWGL